MGKFADKLKRKLMGKDENDEDKRPLEERPMVRMISESDIPGVHYSVKLRRVMEEFKEILKREDLAGQIILHGAEGHTEFYSQPEASWSAAFWETQPDGVQGLRVRARLQEDFNGDREELIRVTTNTMDMLINFKQVNEEHAALFKQIAEMMAGKHGFEMPWKKKEGPA